MSSNKSNKCINQMNYYEFNMLLEALKIKQMCADRKKCSGCIFEDNNECRISMKGIPAAWGV